MIAPSLRSTHGILQAIFSPPVERSFGFTRRMGKKRAGTTATMLALHAAMLKGDGIEADLVKRTGLSAGSIHRILHGQNLTLDTLAQFAAGHRAPTGERLAAWQLLVPGFNPDDPPALLTTELRVELQTLRHFAADVAKRSEEMASGKVVGAGEHPDDDGARKGKSNERSGGKGVKG